MGPQADPTRPGAGRPRRRATVSLVIAMVAVVLASTACSSTSDDADTLDPGASGEELVAAFSSEVDYDEERAGPTSCPIDGVQFTDESRGGPTAWEWDFAGADDSTEQDPFVDGQPSDGEVTLTVTRGDETDSVTEQVSYAVC